MLLMYCLGLCEHCGVIVTMEGRPTDGKWICGCDNELTHKSFGVTENGKKIRWVGPDGKWAKEKPTEDFKIKFGGLEMSIVESRPRATICGF